VPLVPTGTFPKLIVAGELSSPGCVPVPVTAIVIGEFGALLDTEILPLALPADVGENCAVKFTLCPGWITCPAANPPIVKPVPLTLAWAIVTFAEPVFDKVTVAEPLLFTPTFPKLTAAGELANPGCVPVPLSATENGEFDASLASVKLPLAAAAVSGAN